MESSAPRRLKCSGWWEQEGLGRQPMNALHLDFDQGRLHGRGQDVVGEFLFSGRVTADQIRLLKQYIGKHQIEYVGTSDGEGLYRGLWYCFGIAGGEWLIRIESLLPDSGDAEIRQL